MWVLESSARARPSLRPQTPFCKLSNPSHYLSRNSPERAWIYPHSGFGKEVTHSWNHMEESQAVSASDSKLIPDFHKGVLRECLATLPEQATLCPSMALTHGAFLAFQ